MRIHRIVCSGLVVLSLAASGCAGAPPKDAPSAEQEQEEQKATRLLARARETGDVERYRQLVLRFGNTSAAAEARDELAAILIKSAKNALAEQDWSTAEDRAEEARMYAGLELTRKAQAVQQQIDESRAKQVAKDAKKLAEEGKCASALKTVAVPIRQKAREHFKKVVRQQAQEPLVACLSQKLEDDVKAGSIEAARAMLASPDATTALSTEGYKLAEQALLKAIVKESTSEIQPLLAQKKWSEAIAKLDGLKQKGTLGQSEYPVAFEIVQDAIRDHLLALAKQGLTAKKPSLAAQQIEEQAKLAGWKSAPKELQAAQQKLAIAVECEEHRCKLGKPTPSWSWGAIGVHPPADAQGAESGKLKHAQKIWVLGRGKDHALIATEDPGAASGADLFDKAAGWIDPENLRSVDTDMWLPPDAQLVGVQVWGPLRPPSKDYLLGTVTKVDGKKVTVKRMADDREETVDLKSIRIGKLTKGLKVMAFCVDQLHPEPAKVDSVVTTQGGSPKVKVVCEKGDVTRVEVAGALTSKADWLPPRKP